MVRNMRAIDPAARPPRNCAIAIDATYRDTWQDGFGAAGWKLDSGIDDAEVIAATAYTGERIRTSVLVHDMLDHYLSGFPLSGHRNEAAAIAQLGLRTGADIRPDIAQMIDEDVLHGHVIGESLESFLPAALRDHLPMAGDNREKMAVLVRKLGREMVIEQLTARFIALGKAAIPAAEAAWRRQGLDIRRRAALGQCLQRLLERIARAVEKNEITRARATFQIGNRQCAVAVRAGGGFSRRFTASAAR